MKNDWKHSITLAAAAVIACSSMAMAQDADDAPPPADAAAADTTGDTELPEVEVVQTPSTAKARQTKKVVPVSPVGSSTPAGSATPTSTGGAGSGDADVAGDLSGDAATSGAIIEASKIPTTTQVTNSEDFKKYGNPEPQQVLQQSVPGLIINDAAGSTFRSQVEFRGYSVGSLTGFPQGFAVYQNGVRINEVFGDTVFFDVIPSNAISDITLVTGNPVYGLNAVGGGLSILMKDGFNYQGTEIDIMGGSNGRKQLSVQHGAMWGNASTYVAYQKILDSGYRDFSEADIDRFYGDIGLRGSAVEVHFNTTLAQSSAGVVAATPEDMLAIDRRLTFTSPQTTDIEVFMPSINATVKATDTMTVSGLAYYRRFRSDLIDGNVLEGEGCAEILDANDDGFVDADIGDEVDGITGGQALAGALAALGLGAETLCSEEIEDGELQALEDSNGNQIEEDDVGEEPFGVIDRITQKAESWGGSLQAVEEARIFGLKNQFLAGVSYDRGTVRFQTRSEIGTIGNKFIVNGSGITVTEPDDFAGRDVDVTTEYVGLYFSDTVELTNELALTFGLRYNYAMVDLVDLSGEFPGITSNHTFEAFNPNVGATYEVLPGLSVYGSYAESNRAPTPGELACADPDNPCPVESFLTDDPPLEQVETETYEAGVRGEIANNGQRFQFNVGWFRALNKNDILFTASPTTGRGFFLNGGDTLRQGIEAGAKYKAGPWELYANYAYVRATFEDSNEFSSPSNPSAVQCAGTDDDDALCVNVSPGDRIPGIPEHRFKAGVFYDVTPAWTVGATVIAASDQFFLGDEGNDRPTLGGYTRVDLQTSYKVNRNVEFYAFANNVFDREYGLFGTFFDGGEAAEAAEPSFGEGFEFSNSRSVLPAPPVSVYGGVRVTF